MDDRVFLEAQHYACAEAGVVDQEIEHGFYYDGAVRAFDSIQCGRRLGGAVVPIGLRIKLDSVPMAIAAPDAVDLAGQAGEFAGSAAFRGRCEGIGWIENEIHGSVHPRESPAVPFRMLQLSARRGRLSHDFRFVIA